MHTHESKLANFQSFPILFCGIFQFHANVTWFYSTDHELSKRTFLDLIFDSDQLQYLYMVEPGYENEWTLDFFTFPPENQGWIHVNSSNYTRDDIYQHQVLTGNYPNTLSPGIDNILKN